MKFKVGDEVRYKIYIDHKRVSHPNKKVVEEFDDGSEIRIGDTGFINHVSKNTSGSIIYDIIFNRLDDHELTCYEDELESVNKLDTHLPDYL